MAQLWGGRFTKETDELVYRFNASISFDKRLYAQDIKGSMAHVMMLAKQGILTEEEKDTDYRRAGRNFKRCGRQECWKSARLMRIFTALWKQL